MNQLGGKLSDCLGRRAFFLVGPLVNSCIGALVYTNPNSLPLLVATRVLKISMTTFSGSVMCQVALILGVAVAAVASAAVR